jgi:hypothetical protein
MSNTLLLPNVSIDPLGENSPNLVTLLTTKLAPTQIQMDFLINSKLLDRPKIIF